MLASSCAAPSGVPETMPAGAGQTIVGVACARLRRPSALLLASFVSPAKLAPTAPEKAPTWKPPRLAAPMVRVAIPFGFVVAVPTGTD